MPELAGDSADAAQVRSAAVTIARRLAREAVHWCAVGVASDDASGAWRTAVGQGEIGTFAGFGVDVRTSLDAQAHGEPRRSLDLAVLIAGWLRAQTGAEVTVDMHVVAPQTSPQECHDLGRELRAELDREDAPRGLLVVADGATTLTAKAPGSFDPRSQSVQRVIDDALATGDRDALAALDPALCREVGVAGRAAWQVLGGVFDDVPRAEVEYSGAPFGVGYHVGMWRP